jgi:hypothetical protein
LKCYIYAAGVFSRICLPGKWIYRTVSELPWNAVSKVGSFFLMTSALVACGGGGGSIKREVSSAPVNSSSSTAVISSSLPMSSSSSSLSSSVSSQISSSSSSAASSLTDDKILFDDSVQNGVLSAWVDYENVSSVDSYYYDGKISSHIRWEVLETNDTSHGKVVQVTFNALDESDQQQDNGWFGISASQNNSTTDLSGYENGALSFDMRIIQNGTIHKNLLVKAECKFPCTAKDFALEDPRIGVWKNYKIPMKYLIDGGLNTKDVNNLFVIAPNWRMQLGQYIIQLDNIKFEKNYEPSSVSIEKPSSDKVFMPLLPEYGIAIQHSSPDQLNINWSDPFDVELISASTFLLVYANPMSQNRIYPNRDLSDFYHGNILFDLNVINYAGATGEFIASAVSDPSFSLASNTVVHIINCNPCLDQADQKSVGPLYKSLTIPDYRIPAPVAGEWTTYSIPVKDLVDKGLKLNEVFSPLALQFTGPTNQNFRMQVKNVRWEYKTSP